MFTYPSLNRFVNSRAWWLLYLLTIPGMYGFVARLPFPTLTSDTAWLWGYAITVMTLDAVYIVLLLVHLVLGLFED